MHFSSSPSTGFVLLVDKSLETLICISYPWSPLGMVMVHCRYLPSLTKADVGAYLCTPDGHIVFPLVGLIIPKGSEIPRRGFTREFRFIYALATRVPVIEVVILVSNGSHKSRALGSRAWVQLKLTSTMTSLGRSSLMERAPEHALELSSAVIALAQSTITVASRLKCRWNSIFPIPQEFTQE